MLYIIYILCVEESTDSKHHENESKILPEELYGTIKVFLSGKTRVVRKVLHGERLLDYYKVHIYNI